MAKVKQKSKKSVQKRSKYGATKVVVEGIEFDSKKEAERYLFLLNEQAAGRIRDLRRQVVYELLPAIWHEEVEHLKTKDRVKQVCDQRAVTYKADFVYYNIFLGQEIVEDVKGSVYTITPEFKLKEKMMFALLGIRISVFI